MKTSGRKEVLGRWLGRGAKSIFDTTKGVTLFMKVMAFVFLLLVHTASAEAQNLLWYAGMESGNLSDWSRSDCGGEFNSGTSDTQASREKASTGSWSARMAITTPDDPISGTRLFRWCEPRRYQKLYYSAWFFIPTRYQVPNFWNVWQYKSKTSNRNDPFFILNIGNRSNGNMHFYLYDWQRRKSYSQNVADVPVGRWFQIEAFHQCAADNSGRVTFWQDGKMLFDVANVQTRYANGDCQWSVNNYSDMLKPATSYVYVDNAAISLTKIGMSRP
jgi:hypothetical protein